MLYGGGQVSFSTNFVDAETPTGVINGVNNTFALTNIPSPVGSLELYRNGVLQQQNAVDYNIIGNLITFVPASKPQLNDTLIAYYRGSINSFINAVFTDNEIPAGVINGINAVYTTVNPPNPAASLELYKNGTMMIAGGVDYTLVGNQITYVAGQILQVGDIHVCSYRNTVGVPIKPNFVDDEIPAGLINGVNTVYTVASNPNPAASLELYKNGILMQAGGVDFTLAGGNIITYVAGIQPQIGDTHNCSYRK